MGQLGPPSAAQSGTEAWVTQTTGTTRYQAHRRVLVSRAVEVMPDVAAARAMKADQFRHWLDEWARRHSADDGTERDEKLHRRRFWRTRKGDDGMIEGRFRLDPLDGRLVEGGVNGIVDEERRIERGHPNMAGAERTADQRRADAAVEVFRRAAGADAATGRRARPSIAVTTTYDRLISDLQDAGRAALDDGTPLSGAALRRLACEADIIPVVLGTDGMPLDVGRKHRTATWAQRVALRARYHTCAEPGCDRPFDWCARRRQGGAQKRTVTTSSPGSHQESGRLVERDWRQRPRITVERTPRPGHPRPADLSLN